MDWVHCNRCFWQPGQNSNRRIMLTNCGHLLCSGCANLGEIKSCLICHSECVSTLVTANMQNNMEQYFYQPEKSIKKQMEVLEFQSNHRNRFFRHLIEKCKALETELSKQQDEIRRHREEKNKLKDELNIKIEEIKRHREEKNQLKSQLNNKENTMWPVQNLGGSRSSLNSQYMSSPMIGGSQQQFGNRSKNVGQPLNNNRILNNNQSQSKTFLFHLPNDSSSPTTNEGVFTPPTYQFKNIYRDYSLAKSPTVLTKSSPDLLSPPSPVVPRTAVQRKVALPGDKTSSPINKLQLQRLSLKTATPSYCRTTPSHVKVAGRPPRTSPTPLHSISKFNKFF